MRSGSITALILIAFWSICGGAQEASSILEAAAAALGASNLRSIEFSGRGSDYVFGQSYDGGSPWPRFSVPRMIVTIDYATPSIRDDRRRVQVQNPPLGGGFQPLAGEQRQVWMMSGQHVWDMVGGNAVPASPERDFRRAVDGRLAQIWLTPHGFLKAAIAYGATARTEKVRGVKKIVVAFTAPNKARFEGVVNEQNLIERIYTWLDSPVLGDTKFEATFSGYKDFGGVKFPTNILQREGGYPVLDLTVTAVNPNVAVAVEIPQALQNAPLVTQTPEAHELSDGVWVVPGNAKTVAVEFRDHMVLVDAPENEARSLVVIEALKKALPHKPIRYVVNTHMHFDHAGGLRTYAAEGATIITYAGNVPFYEQVWANPRTINPDRLARSNRKAELEGIVGNRTLTDGSRELVIYHYAGNMHNTGMLMVFLPKERILIEADSYTPSANPSDPPGAVANLVHFYEFVDRLRLDVEQVVPIHGRLATFDDMRQAAETFGKDQLWAR